jgi:hypothetical protein
VSNVIDAADLFRPPLTGDDRDLHQIEQLHQEFFERDDRPVVAMAGLSIAKHTADAFAADQSVAPAALHGMAIAAECMLLYCSELNPEVRAVLELLREVAAPSVSPGNGWGRLLPF